MAPVRFCPEHGVCGLGRRMKACVPMVCKPLRSDLCQHRVTEAGGWGLRQCFRKPLGTGYCKQHREAK